GADVHAAACVPLLVVDAAQPAAGLDPVARAVQPGRLGRRRQTLRDRFHYRLGPDRDTRRLPRAPARRERRLRNPRLRRLSTPPDPRRRRRRRRVRLVDLPDRADRDPDGNPAPRTARLRSGGWSLAPMNRFTGTP